jgi:uncharacterized membrane protein required for colicin V production
MDLIEFNSLDVLIIIVLAIGTVVGFFKRLLRKAMNIAALYIATLLAMQFYFPLGKWMSELTSTSLKTTRALSFSLILVITDILLNFLARCAYKDTRLPFLGYLDQMGGLLIGFASTCAWISLAIPLLSGVPWLPFKASLYEAIRSSALVSFFDNLLPLLLATLRPWLPGGIPPIFSE